METGMSRNGQNGVPAYQRIQGAIRERITAGESLRKVAASLNISPALLSKRLREKQAA